MPRVRRRNPSFPVKTLIKEHASEGPGGGLTASALPARGNRAANMRKPRSVHPGRVDAEARILASAAEMFSSFGYNGVSTRDIASEASVNEVTIYRHYPRKRDLYVAVLDAELQQVKLRGDLLAGIADAGEAVPAAGSWWTRSAQRFAPLRSLRRLRRQFPPAYRRAASPAATRRQEPQHTGRACAGSAGRSSPH